MDFQTGSAPDLVRCLGHWYSDSCHEATAAIIIILFVGLGALLAR